MSKEEKKDAAPAPQKVFSQEDLQAAMKVMAKSMAEEMLPMMVAASQMNRPQQPAAPVRHTEVCGDCQQLKVACSGEHTKMVVYPQKYTEFGPWFQGVFINGVRYLSNDASHEVLVPKAAQGAIAKIVQDYEENERVTRQGRTKFHNSGSVNAPVAASSGWR